MDLHSVIPKSCLVSVVFVVEGDGDFGRCFAISVVGLSALGFERMFCFQKSYVSGYRLIDAYSSRLCG